MNRGYDGRPIFTDALDKDFLVSLFEKNQDLTKVSLLTYCVMDNHYHLVLQNTSERMADFFKQVNGQYGTYFRKKYGGRGYVFQDRYKSQLIQDDAYLMVAIAYVLNNPVKAGLVKTYPDYTWSSGRFYFNKTDDIFVDTDFVNELMGDEKNLQQMVARVSDLEELPTVKSEMGMIVGGEEFISEAMDKADRRKEGECLERKRCDDRFFDSVEKVMFEFQNKHGVLVNELNGSTYSSKRMRAELLVNLKDKAGLRYTELIKFDAFGDLTINSLASIYHRYKKKK